MGAFWTMIFSLPKAIGRKLPIVQFDIQGNISITTDIAGFLIYGDWYEMQTIKIQGKFSEVIVYATDNEDTALDDYAKAQLQLLADNEASKGSKIRVMPDVHPAKVCTVGLTMTVGERILPEAVSSDIGCGLTVARLKKFRPDFQKLDKAIMESVPSGTSIRKKPHHLSEAFDFGRLCAEKHIHKDRALRSLGSLGSGNHMLEIDKDDNGNHYLVIHSGSRHLGKELTDYYLAQGQNLLKERGFDVPYELTWLDGELMEAYLHDLAVVQEFAALNRRIMAEEICKAMKWKTEEIISCAHNYVDFRGKTPILRKGAISAVEDEPVIIPINMRDGVLLGRGKGNDEWNQSAPHGAGRILKRVDVKNRYTVSDFKREMKGIYSPSISKETLDEAPFAYRAMDEILDAIKDTVEVTKILRPAYNFKAGNTEG